MIFEFWGDCNNFGFWGTGFSKGDALLKIVAILVGRAVLSILGLCNWENGLKYLYNGFQHGLLVTACGI